MEDDGNGNAATLSFGKGFVSDDGEAFEGFVMNEEAFVLMDTHPQYHDYEVVKTTLDYLREVSLPAREQDVDSVRDVSQEVRRILVNMDLDSRDQTTKQRLHTFEMVQLSNLVDVETSVEEIMTCITTLSRFDEQSIALVLEAINNAKTSMVGR